MTTSSQQIESILQESRVFPPPPDFSPTPRLSRWTSTARSPRRRRPAMLRPLYKDDARYIEYYWAKFGEKNLYFAGDGARRDEDGYFWLRGASMT